MPRAGRIRRTPTSAVADFEFAGRLEPATTLHEIKQSKLFEDWALVRQGRLSTMAAPEKFVEWMRKRYPKAKIYASRTLTSL